MTSLMGLITFLKKTPFKGYGKNVQRKKEKQWIGEINMTGKKLNTQKL